MSDPKQPSKEPKAPKAKTKIDSRLIDWGAILVARLRSFADEWSLVTKHPVLVGTGREQAFVKLIEGVLPRRYEALEGALALVRDSTPMITKDQFDVIVADTLEYPCVIRNARSAVVLPQSVKIVAEVKSSLSASTAPPPRPRQLAETGDAAPPLKGKGDEETPAAPKAGAENDAKTTFLDQEQVNAKVSPKGVEVDGSLVVVSRTSDSIADAVLHLGRVVAYAPQGKASIMRILFAYEGPAQLSTVKDWIETLLALRTAAKMDAVAAGLEDGDVDALSSAAFPEVIAILEPGFYGWKQDGKFHLVQAGPGDILAQILTDVHAEVQLAPEPRRPESEDDPPKVDLKPVSLSASVAVSEIGLFLSAKLRKEPPLFTFDLRDGELQAPPSDAKPII